MGRKRHGSIYFFTRCDYHHNGTSPTYSEPKILTSLGLPVLLRVYRVPLFFYERCSICVCLVFFRRFDHFLDYSVVLNVNVQRPSCAHSISLSIMVSFDPLYQPLLSFMSYVGLWRLAALAFVLANLKVLPFGWHVSERQNKSSSLELLPICSRYI